MTLVFKREPVKRFLKWGQRALFACASCCWVLRIRYGGRLIFQRRESRELDRLLRDRQAASQNARRRSPPLPGGRAATRTVSSPH